MHVPRITEHISSVGTEQLSLVGPPMVVAPPRLKLPHTQDLHQPLVCNRCQQACVQGSTDRSGIRTHFDIQTIEAPQTPVKSIIAENAIPTAL